MYYLKDYVQEHKTACPNSLDDAQISHMFSQPRQENMLLFFQEWMKIRKQKEHVAYDVTSYGKQIEGLEGGDNRDKEKLPQINIGMYYGEESGLPLY